MDFMILYFFLCVLLVRTCNFIEPKLERGGSENRVLDSEMRLFCCLLLIKENGDLK